MNPFDESKIRRDSDGQFAEKPPAAEADDVELDEHAEVHVPVSLHTAQMDSAFEGAPLYQKTAKVNARQASAGEKISTVLADGTVETSNTASEGDYVVTNPGGDEYIVPGEKFAKRYGQTDDPGVYQAKGQVFAVENPTGQSIEIDSPWGEKMRGGPDCLVVAQPDENGQPGQDRYIIGRQEFDDTYGEA